MGDGVWQSKQVLAAYSKLTVELDVSGGTFLQQLSWCMYQKWINVRIHLKMLISLQCVSGKLLDTIWYKWFEFDWPTVLTI